MKKIVIFIFSLHVVVFANPITLHEAQNVALNWMGQKINSNFTIKKSNIAHKTSQNQNYFIVALEPKGWAIVSGDDKFSPIIGYGLSNSDTIPEGLSLWLNDISTQMTNAKKSTKNIKNKSLSTKWNKLKQDPSVSKNIFAKGKNDYNFIVKPLLWLDGEAEGSGIKLFQEDPLNKYCPGNSLVGCVATAITQIMTYHKYPNHGTGSHSYNHGTYGTLSKDFSQSYYDWDNMAIDILSGSTALDNTAKLSYDIAVSVDMMFSPDGSGAFDIDAQNALNSYFFYKSKLRNRSDYSDNEWHKMLKNELNHARPVFYGGIANTAQAGHAFVMDGYDDDGYYHFNFGWAGYFNGKYLIDHLTTGNGDFSYYQDMITMVPYNKYIIDFKDENLKNCIQNNLSTTSPSITNLDLLTLEDTLSITSLDCSNFGIVDIGLLEDFKNLTYLNLTGNYIDDFSIEDTLPNLTVIGKNEQSLYPDQYEPNNNFSLAKSVQKGSLNLSFYENDEDYFTFTLPHEANITVQTSGMSGDTILYLYDEDENFIVKNDDISKENRFSKITKTLSKGKYYIEVKRWGGLVMNHYKLHVDIPDSSNQSAIYYLLLN